MSEPLPEVLDLPYGRAARGVVEAPASKSHAIRLLIAAALAEGVSTISRVPAGDDVTAVLGALRALGIDLRQDGDRVRVTGCNGILPSLDREEVRLDLGGSGTGLRLLAAVCCLGRGPYLLDGDASLRARPAAGAVEVVEALGCRAESDHGRPPLRISGGPVHRLPNDIRAPDVSRSSQPLSALALAGAVLPGARRTVDLGRDPVSMGYVALTLDVLRSFGATPGSLGVGHTDLDTGAWVASLLLPDGPLRAIAAGVEGDWSSVAFLLGAAAASDGEVLVRGVDPETRQPDARVVEILRSMGAEISATVEGVACWGADGLVGTTVSLRDAPDLAPLVGALGCVAQGVTQVSGAPHLRIKESDRIAAVVAAARAIGCHAEEREDGFVIHGGGGTGGVVDPRGDHRIAMAFAIAGLAIPGVRIRDPGCVAKSYPGFWDDLTRLTASG